MLKGSIDLKLRLLAQSGAETFRAVVDGSPRELVRPVRDEAYRIAREAMLNAFRHARAGSIELQIIDADESLHIRVRDDGSGIDPVALASGSRSGHGGLPGMRERAQRIGARLDVWSRPGARNEIELIDGVAANDTGTDGAPAARQKRKVAPMLKVRPIAPERCSAGL